MMRLSLIPQPSGRMAWQHAAGLGGIRPADGGARTVPSWSLEATVAPKNRFFCEFAENPVRKLQTTISGMTGRVPGAATTSRDGNVRDAGPWQRPVKGPVRTGAR